MSPRRIQESRVTGKSRVCRRDSRRGTPQQAPGTLSYTVTPLFRAMISPMSSLLQRVQLAWRGWSRRRDEDARRRNEEFLARNTAWTMVGGAGSPIHPCAAGSSIDREGLQVAFLDDSGRFAYWLDLESGEIVEFPAADAARHAYISQSPRRYRRVPTRTETSDAADRHAFVAALELSRVSARLAEALGDPAAFRSILSTDRTIERAWFSFKNDRASAAIEGWLRELTVD
jgi:Uncharacterised protein family (UPF0158)